MHARRLLIEKHFKKCIQPEKQTLLKWHCSIVGCCCFVANRIAYIVKVEKDGVGMWIAVTLRHLE